MHARILTACAFAALTAVPALADDKADVTNTVDQYLAAFNKGDQKAWASFCLGNTTIVDEIAPYIWQGANACTDWWKDLDAVSKKNGMSIGKVSRGKPVHLEAADARAYAVFPATYSYKMKGKPTSDKGLWTFTLQKSAAGWQVTGWAWAAQK